MKPKFMIVVSALLMAVFAEASQRDKKIDENYQLLTSLSLYKEPCVKPHLGIQKEYGIINGGLEKCQVFFEEQEGLGTHEEHAYEKYKCKHLRVHAKLDENSGKCVCEGKWKGPICNEYDGCPAGYSLFSGVCTPNVCQHNGTLALGSQRIECICEAPWDGRWCDRLACWRMAEKEFERRWRNHIDHCVCAEGYAGENCDKIQFCKNGLLVSDQCQCAEGWKGEICDRKCIPNQTCGAATLVVSKIFIVGFALLCSVLFILRKE